MAVENIMKLIDRTLVDSVALGVAEIAGINDAKERCTKDAQESYARLRAAVEELAKDAARYRWLRDSSVYIDREQAILRMRNVYLIESDDFAYSFDEAIDEAMKGQS